MSTSEVRQPVFYFGNFLAARGRVPQVCELLARCWRDAGLDVRCTSRREARPARFADFTAAAVRARRAGGSVVVDTFSGRSFLWARTVVGISRASCPCVLMLRGGSLPDFGKRNPDVVGKVLGSVAAVVSPSRFLQREMRAFRDDILFIPNPVTIERYDPRPGPRIPDPDGPRILWLRAFHRVYDPASAVRALAALRATCPDARLSMAGHDKDGSEPETRDLANSLGVGDAVSFLGMVPKEDVPALMREHDIFLSTATVDNAPVSVLEGMAAGMPVVATNVGGVPDLLDEGAAGVLFEPGDVPSLTGALVELAADSARAERLGSRARQRAEGHDLPRVAGAWIDLLRRVSGTRVRAAVSR